VSDTNELDRLRADLEVLERYQRQYDMMAGNAIIEAKNSIANLEAEAADPWADAKRIVSHWQDCPESNYGHTQVVVEYVHHLEADNAKLKAEIDTLKAEPHADENGYIVFPDDKAEANPWREAQNWVLAEFVHLGGPAPAALYVQHLEADNAKQAARIAEQNEWLEEWDKVAWKILPGFDAPPNPSHVDKRVEELKSLVVEFQQNAESERSEKNGLLIETALKRDEIAGLRRIIAELESRPIPPLDPKRVIATACKVIAKENPHNAAYIMQLYQAGDAGIYPLAGDEPI
jgi:hypothetical protein